MSDVPNPLEVLSSACQAAVSVPAGELAAKLIESLAAAGYTITPTQESEVLDGSSALLRGKARAGQRVYLAGVRRRSTWSPVLGVVSGVGADGGALTVEWPGMVGEFIAADDGRYRPAAGLPGHLALFAGHSFTGTFQAMYSEAGDCVCCPGRHAFSRYVEFAEGRSANDLLMDFWKHERVGRQVRLSIEVLEPEAAAASGDHE